MWEAGVHVVRAWQGDVVSVCGLGSVALLHVRPQLATQSHRNSVLHRPRHRVNHDKSTRIAGTVVTPGIPSTDAATAGE